MQAQIIDTPGQDRFNSLNEFYYNKCDSIILVYDIINKQTFDECREYFCKKIKEKCNKNIRVILIGNKKDLENNRQVSFKEANDFALLNNYTYMEASCLRNENVFELFEKIFEITLMEKKNENKNNNNNTCIIF